MKRFNSLLALGLIVLLSSCASSLKEYPKFDQVLIYEKPYDLTFLRTLEALNTVAGWTLEETDKGKGMIMLRNTEYGNLFDRDKWLVRFNVVSLGRKKTSVSIDPSSQSNAMGGELLKRVDQIMKLTDAVKTQEPVAALT